MTHDSPLYVIIDTPLFIHFLPPNEIPWLQLTQEKSVCLIMTDMLLKQVSDQKDRQSRQRLKDTIRARERWLRDTIKAGLPQSLGPGVSIDRAPHEATRPDVVDLHLDPGVSDNYFVATACLLRDRLGYRMAVMAEDLGMLMKLQPLNLRPVEVPDDYRVKAEPTVEEKELKSLREENALLRNRVPKLDLTFREEDTPVTRRHPIPEWTNEDEFVALSLRNHLRKYPQLEAQALQHRTRASATTSIGRDALLARQSAEYLERYESYLYEEWHFRKEEFRLIPMRLTIQNTGTAKATDLTITLSVPDGLKVIHSWKNASRPAVPDLPRAYMNSVEAMHMAMDRHLQSNQIYSAQALHGLDPAVPKVLMYPDEQTVRIGLPSLQHGSGREVPLFYLLLEEGQPLRVYPLPYTTQSDEQPRSGEGVLKIEVYRNSGRSQPEPLGHS